MLDYLNHSSKTKCRIEISSIEVDALLQNYIQSLLFIFKNPELVADELFTLKVKEVILLLLNANNNEAQKIKAILTDIFNPSEVSFREILYVI